MSLDVSLYWGDPAVHGSGIFIRENGTNRELTRAEWDEKFPGKEPVIAKRQANNEVFSANITHNLNRMADSAGLYFSLWRPDEAGFTKAQQLIEPMRKGLAELKSKPSFYKEMNPENGWGSYEILVSFVEQYLAACEQYPDADIYVSR